MGQPILDGYQFKIERKINKGTYTMRAYDVYQDYHSFGYLYSGNRLVITPEKTCTVTKGTIVFIHKNMPHRTTGKLDENYENFSIKFRDSVLERLIHAVGEQAVHSLFQQIAITLSDDTDRKVRSLIDEIEHEWNTYSSSSNLMLECLFTQMLLLIIKDQSETLCSRTGISEKQKILLDAINYLESNYFLDPSLEETAAAIHISKSYLSKIFTTEMNASYSKYLLCLKIKYAQNLLANTELPITEISVNTGFKNNNYFCDAFKKIVGNTPSQYRKKLKKESA